VQDQAFVRQMCISVATSASPDGPFVDRSTGPLVCQTHLGGSIDPAPFVDEDGSRWLVWKSNGDSPTCGCPSSLWSQRLSDDGASLVGDPTLLLTVAEPWEQPLIEGPQLERSGNVYYLLYAGNWWNTAQYAIGVATCAGPSGPCSRLSVDAPFVASRGATSGPGGPVTFHADGERWLGYAAWTTGAVATPGAGRAMRIDRIELPDAGHVSTDAPTTADEPL
jgi:beta-xylosidase